MTERQLFFDHLVSRYERALQKPHIPDMQVSFAEDGTPSIVDKKAYRVLKREIIADTLQVLRQSKLFLLNGAVVDDLYHMTAEYTDFETATKLPFPSIFFEFMDSLEVERIYGEKTRLTALMIGQSSATDPFYRWTAKKREMPSGTFSFLFFYDTMKEFDLPDNVTCGAHELHLVLEPKEFKIGTLFETDMLTRPAESMNTNFYSEMVALSLNTISYINAHNVTIRRQDRQNSDLGRINVRRVRDGKNSLPNLKPYYWIDVRQNEARERDEEGESKMDYREWVRGAFHRYHTRTGVVKNWVQPYVRGPNGAPWKENRYRVLADMLQKVPRL